MVQEHQALLDREMEEILYFLQYILVVGEVVDLLPMMDKKLTVEMVVQEAVERITLQDLEMEM